MAESELRKLKLHVERLVARSDATYKDWLKQAVPDSRLIPVEEQVENADPLADLDDEPYGPHEEQARL